MYPKMCDCLDNSDDADEDEIYDFLPPLDVKDIPWFINKPRKWTD